MYNKKQWESNELITKEALNNIENGIENLNNSLLYTNILTLGFDIKINSGESVTLAFREAIDYCMENGLRPFIPKGEYVFSPESDGRVTYNCWVVPDGLTAYFEKGATFKLVDDPKIESKLVYMGNDVKFFGELTLVGNADRGPRYGEMQSNMFIYQKQNIYIESLISKESWGDNMFIGGERTDYNTLSRNIKIDYFKGIDAKRKNLVFQDCTDVYIKTAYLDNSRYSLNSLDVEPDNWRLSNLCATNTIDYLYVKGTGIDFSASTDSEVAKRYIVNINKFVVDVTAGSAAVLLSYAMTLNIKEFILNSIADGVVINRLIDTTYGSFISIDNLVILSDKINELLRMSASTGALSTRECPVVEIGNLMFIRNEYFYAGVLIKNDGGTLKLGDIEIVGHDDVVIRNNSTSESCSLYADRIRMHNCGKDDAALIILDRINGDEYANICMTVTTIKNVAVTYDDDINVNLYAIIQVNEENTTDHLKIGSIINPHLKKVLNANGLLNPILATKIGGIDGMPCVYSTRQSPEGQLIAPKGSLVICTDGKMYIKTTDETVSTGWIVK